MSKQDLIKVEILDHYFFRDLTGTRTLSNETYIMTRKIDKQLLNDIPSQILEKSKIRV